MSWLPVCSIGTGSPWWGQSSSLHPERTSYLAHEAQTLTHLSCDKIKWKLMTSEPLEMECWKGMLKRDFGEGCCNLPVGKVLVLYFTHLKVDMSHTSYVN